MSGGKFEHKHDGVTYTVEFDLDRDGVVESMGVFVGDSPDISAVCLEEFLKELENKCYEHLPEPFDSEDDL